MGKESIPLERQINQLKMTLIQHGTKRVPGISPCPTLYTSARPRLQTSKSSGVPNARIYGVLDELSQKGLIIVRPGRPALYAPLTPEEIADALVSASREEIRKQLKVIEDYRDDFERVSEDVFLKAGTAEQRTSLIRIVSVGDVSLEETKKLYRQAREKLYISTRAMEYLDEVKDELIEAAEHGI